MRDDQILRLQKHLPLFRACAGWTAQDLADMLDVSRQTVSAWENYDVNSEKKKGAKLTTVNYLAIRQLLETAYRDDLTDEEKAKKKRHILETMLEVIVDNPQKYGQGTVDAVLAEAELLAPSIREQPGKRKEISKTWWKVLLGAGGVALGAALIAFLGHDDD